MVTVQQRLDVVGMMHDHGVSVRRGCALARISRNAVSYVSRRAPDDELVEAIQGVRKKHPCYGYRRTHAEITQGAKGMLNHKRLHRVCRENGMQHPQRKRRRRRTKKGQVPLQAAHAMLTKKTRFNGTLLRTV